MKIEKPEQQPRPVHVIWSPSRNLVKVAGKKVEVPLPLSEEVCFEFYRPAISSKGGVYAEA
jgi:hypothetical protein